MTRATCKAPGCDREVKARGLCNKHYKKLWRRGLLSRKVPAYLTFHRTLRTNRGSARGQVCVDCGSRAAEWSYQGDCAEEHTDKKTEMRYCLHMEHYAPRCVPCHKRFDGHYGQGNPNAKLSEADMTSIAARRAAGEKLQSIADDYGISDVRVSQIFKKHHPTITKEESS